MSTSPKPTVLVTGGSGFLGSWCVVYLLNEGYTVKTTLRSIAKKQEVLDALKVGGITDVSKVSFIEAELTSDAGWEEAVKDCTYVLHVASPFPAAPPKHENDLIIPAREGTLRVVKAAAATGTVKRIVVTSSFAAIGYGHEARDESQPFTEKDFTVVENSSVPAYHKSKALAERAAWDFIKEHQKGGGTTELAVVNPGGIFGPVLSAKTATSVEIVSRLLTGNVPGCPKLEFGIVDVRDVADLHLLAMTSPAAAGERFLAISPPPVSMQEISLILKKKLGDKAKKAPTLVVPNFVLRIVALWDPAVALIVGELGKHKPVSNEKAIKVLGWKPRTVEEAVTSCAESLFELGVVKV
jgi:nucleoside-diphosphate-sugar epimerase